MTAEALRADRQSFQFELAQKGPQLRLEDELSLARRWREQGDREAADTLVRAQLRTVTTLAAKYRRYGVPVAELVAEGNCGLVHALGKFDPDRGFRFGTYAAHWIRAQMLAYIIRSRSIVGGTGGPMRSQLFFKFRRERARIAGLFGEGDVGRAELASRMGLSQARVEEMIQRLDCQDVSLDVPAHDDAPTTRLDRLESGSNPEQLLCDARRATGVEAAIAAALGALDPRERYIVDARMMADRAEELSLAEIGRALGVSRERARQLELRAKKKLRRLVESSSPAVVAEWAAASADGLVAATTTAPANDDFRSPTRARRPRK